MTQSNRGSREEGEARVTLGRVIAALRSAHGWTQADLAAASGVAKAQISRYERDVDQPSYSTQRALYEALRVSPGEVDELQAMLDRIVHGRDRGASPARMSRADLSILARVMGFGEGGSAGRSAGDSSAGDSGEAPRTEQEVEALAREAGEAVARFVRLHFAHLDRSRGNPEK